MGDFAQDGVICTLQRLREPQGLEAELRGLAKERPIALILPCHRSDFGQPALEHIRAELSGADWIREIVVSLNGFAKERPPEAQAFFAGFPQKVHVLWNDDPALQSSYADLLQCPTAKVPMGKGFNVWAAVGYLAATSRPDIVALQDCDVKSFRREALARLCFTCAEPELNFSLAKMYYPRVTDRLYGRVSRLFLTPLLRALGSVVGPEPLLGFLRSFRYPLAGEVALRSSLAQRLSLPSGWSLEIGTLCEAFREIDPHMFCQVDGGDAYDHKHQLQRETLSSVCHSIYGTLLTHLAAAGAECQAASHLHLRRALEEEGHEAIRRYAALARLNELPFDRSEEESLVHWFASAISQAATSPEAILPAWHGLLQERPVAVEAFAQAVTEGSRSTI